ncbi:MAG: hypothetical protein WBW38_00170 [Candidatus Sulfotelmatobacter sp.]
MFAVFLARAEGKLILLQIGLKASEQVRHCRIEAARDYLQRDDSGLSLAPLYVRQMPSIHVQMNRQIRLRITLFLAESLDPYAQL